MDVLSQIRDIRKKEDIKLKPSPYLKDNFINEWGSEQKVVIRNYQGSGIMNLLMVPSMILGDDTGLGKAQPVDSLVLTPNGWVQIGSLKVGDKVIGSNGEPIKVVGIFPQGKKNTYEVIMSDGFSTKCCDEHLWTVRTGNSRRFSDGWHTLSLKDIMNSGLLRQKNSNGLRYSIPIVSPVKFEEKKLPIDPYLLGVILGDGSIHNSISVCSGDEEIFSLIKERLPENYILNQIKGDKYSKRISSNRPGVRSDLLSSIKELGLFRSNWYTKFIPNIYLFSSVNQRIELLQGLMDTDGYISKDGHVTQFYSSSLSLVNDITHLIQSLGGTAKIKKKKPVLGEKSKAKNAKMSYIVTISLPNEIVPFKISRKVKRWKPRTKYLPSRQIKEIKKNPVKEECVCIKVKAKDQLYVTDNFIVTHNTLQVLSTIGYVWLKEPEFIPIVVTRKSSLYQWSAEVDRFMQNMETITVDNDPYERDALYTEFFDNHDVNSKKLLIMTYEIMFKDMHRSVVRDRTKPKTKEEKKALSLNKKNLKTLRAKLKKDQEKYEELKKEFNTHFSQKPDPYKEYVRDMLKPPIGAVAAPKPGTWDSNDQKLFVDTITLKDDIEDMKEKEEELKDLVAPPVVIPGILEHVQSLLNKNPESKIMLIMDEVHSLKNHRGKMHKTIAELSKVCNRRIGMTATPIKNRLEEFFAIFKIIEPKLFPTLKFFHDNYCNVEFQKIPGGKKIPIIKSHNKAHLQSFVQRIEPYYLSRKKHEVAKELPEVINREIICILSPEQEELYELAELGLLETADSVSSDNEENQSAEMLKAMTMVQQACNAPQLLMNEEGVPYEGDSCKRQAIMDILEECADMKVIIYSQYEKMISIIEEDLKKAKIKCVRITGKENKAKDREKAKELFQDSESGVNVILITAAGGESINLHAAEQIIYVENPWSYGDYVQLNGRAVRIGSRNKSVLITHLTSRKSGGGKTIDNYRLDKLRSKKRLSDTVSGETIKGGLKFNTPAEEAMELFLSIKNDLKTGVRIGTSNKQIFSTSSKKRKDQESFTIDLESII